MPVRMPAMFRRVLAPLSWRVSSLAFVLAFCAMFVRAVVPVGFMPDMAAVAQGKIQLVLCTVDGPISIALSDASPDHSDSSASQLEPCPFGLAGASVPLLHASPATSIVRVASSASPWPASHTALPVQPATGPPLGARAPPTFIL